MVLLYIKLRIFIEEIIKIYKTGMDNRKYMLNVHIFWKIRQKYGIIIFKRI